MYLNNDNICVCFKLSQRWCPMRVSSCTLFLPLAFLASLDIPVTPSIHPRPLSPSPAPLPQPDLLRIIGQGPQSSSQGGIGSLMHLLKAVVSDHGCQKEGKGSTSHLPQLPPPSGCFWERALPGRCLGRWWLLFPSSLPLPPSSCPLSIPLLPSSLPFSLLPFPLLSFLPLSSLFSSSLPPPLSPSSFPSLHPPPPLGNASLWLRRWKVTQGSTERKDILMYFKILSPYDFL